MNSILFALIITIPCLPLVIAWTFIALFWLIGHQEQTSKALRRLENRIDVDIFRARQAQAHIDTCVQMRVWELQARLMRQHSRGFTWRTIAPQNAKNDEAAKVS